MQLIVWHVCVMGYQTYWLHTRAKDGIIYARHGRGTFQVERVVRLGLTMI